MTCVLCCIYSSKDKMISRSWCTWRLLLYQMLSRWDYFVQVLRYLNAFDPVIDKMMPNHHHHQLRGGKPMLWYVQLGSTGIIKQSPRNERKANDEFSNSSFALHVLIISYVVSPSSWIACSESGKALKGVGDKLDTNLVSILLVSVVNYT